MIENKRLKYVDVVVCGGGPAGIGAAVGAARVGARVALVERHDVLGGMGTAALVNNFCPAHWDGHRLIIGGVFGQIRQRLIDRRKLYITGSAEPFDPVAYGEETRSACEAARVQVMCGSEIAKVRFDTNTVTITLTDDTRLVASQAVDTTGDGMLATAAGVPFDFGRESDGAVMPLTMCYTIGSVDIDRLAQTQPELIGGTDEHTGERWVAVGTQSFVNDCVAQARRRGELTIPRDKVAMVLSVPGQPTQVSVNFGRVFVSDPTDPQQLARAEAQGRGQVEEGVRFFRKYIPGFEHVELIEVGRQIGVRESRHIQGLYVLTAEDLLACRQFEDVIAQCWYPIDIHLPDEETTVMKWLPKGEHYDIPWRCMVPRDGAQNIVFGGRCISAMSEAASSFRVSPSCMAIGEAAGITAALANREGLPIADIAPSSVQQELLKHGGILS